MNDPVLLSRLDALWDDLNLVREKLKKDTWSSAEQNSDTRAEMSADSLLWPGLEVTLGKQIEKKQNALKRIEESVITAKEDDLCAMRAAWTDYATIFKESESILHECLEIIGTLAIRNKDLDQRILYVADELIRECLSQSTDHQDYYLLVHGLEDTVTKTKARIIRLRFPEWTIWDLPLAAHELGYVLVTETLKEENELEEDDRLWLPFVKEQSSSLVAVDSEFQKSQAGEIGQDQEADKWRESRVHKFLADAFATYTMGPAYACSAILLRLNPSLGASCGTPSDIQRAQIILSTLTCMDDKEKIMGPYTKVIEKLGEYWNSTVSRVNPSGKLEPDYETWLWRLAEKFSKELGPTTFRAPALYAPIVEKRGWQRANEWSHEWLKQWNSNQNLSVPQPSNDNLRDALNATWLCRLQIHDDIKEQSRKFKELQEVGRQLCTTIKTQQTTASQPQHGITPKAGGRG
ncbi:MAG TPA: hypothetical protein VJ810_17455 [Blastocatellia bacterium]|nr:hypothetical protein [Blastocatellia bacterium]